MSTEDKFNAAVQIIRSLPNEGSFQPSNETKLIFYSHFKQATEGPCEGTRPSFWDLVGRAKYDAWKGLGSMTKEEAKEKYVSEFVDMMKKLLERYPAEEVRTAVASAKPEHLAMFKDIFGDIV